MNMINRSGTDQVMTQTFNRRKLSSYWSRWVNLLIIRLYWGFFTHLHPLFHSLFTSTSNGTSSRSLLFWVGVYLQLHGWKIHVTFSTSTVLFTSSWTLQPLGRWEPFFRRRKMARDPASKITNTPLVPKEWFLPYPFWFRSPTEHRTKFMKTRILGGSCQLGSD